VKCGGVSEVFGVRGVKGAFAMFGSGAVDAVAVEWRSRVGGKNEHSCGMESAVL
jgi:hypothetical protein